MKDIAGKEIKKGDVVVAALNTKYDLCFGVVDSISQKTVKVNWITCGSNGFLKTESKLFVVDSKTKKEILSKVKEGIKNGYGGAGTIIKNFKGTVQFEVRYDEEYDGCNVNVVGKGIDSVTNEDLNFSSLWILK